MPPVGAPGDDGGGEPPRPFLVLRDARETQPDERLQTDGVQERIILDRQHLQAVWPALTHWVETGEWKAPDGPSLPPFPGAAKC